jgi:hypothetical protein
MVRDAAELAVDPGEDRQRVDGVRDDTFGDDAENPV